MSEERLGIDIRDAFDSTHEPNPGLEDRVMAAIPWDAPRRRRLFQPRLAGAFAGALAIVIVVALLAPTIASRLNIAIPGFGGVADTPAYSLASVTSGSVFVVQRGRGPEVLLQSRDGGRSWTSRLRFDDVYDGMQMFGQDGYIWSLALNGTNCTDKRDPNCHPPIFAISLYRTSDGGATWTGLKAPTFPANGAYFIDAQHGWIDSGSPFAGLGNDVLYSTVDGGNSWSYVGPLPKSAPMVWVSGAGLYHVTFSSTTRGWYLGNNELFTTYDGGRSWFQLHLPVGTGTQTPSQPVFNGQDGVLPIAKPDPNGPDNAYGNKILFFPTTNGGESWGAPTSAPAGFTPVGDVISITILDPQHIWLTSQSLTGGDNVQASPAVARTSDGGLTWTVTHHTPRILQMTFSDATHGYALDVTGTTNVNGILSTHDAGATWQRVNVPYFS